MREMIMLYLCSNMYDGNDGWKVVFDVMEVTAN